jgi:tRNA A-37 threonylcarbamoyl transferase component Bud32
VQSKADSALEVRGRTETERVQHRLLAFMAIFMSGGAVVWSGLAFAFGFTLPGAIPVFYIAATGLNFALMRLHHDKRVVRFVQILASVLLPFVFQWTIGGFAASGAVMLWALVAIVGALTFTEPRTVVKWLVVYAALAIVSGLVDGRMQARFSLPLSARVTTAFFVVNIVLVSIIVIALMVYFLDQRQRAVRALADARDELRGLEDQVRKLGQYTLLAKIGEGGMGTVHRAEHVMLRRPTAIKLIRAELTDEATLGRFEREVQLTATLSHPNIVTVFDYGRTDDGTFYYAMEYLDGADLATIVGLERPMPPARVIHVLVQTVEALAEAHGKGLIHRDIKPQNVLLTRGYVPDLVKVVDFGLVKDLGGSDPSLSFAQLGVAAGTPHYMSPEAIMNPETTDARTDVYAVGCLAYYLLAGCEVFQGKSSPEIIGHQLQSQPIPLAVRVGATIPKALDEIVARCLAKRREDRPSTRGLLEALRKCAREHPWTELEAEAWWKKHHPAIVAQREGAALAGTASARSQVTAIARIARPAA